MLRAALARLRGAARGAVRRQRECRYAAYATAVFAVADIDYYADADFRFDLRRSLRLLPIIDYFAILSPVYITPVTLIFRCHYFHFRRLFSFLEGCCR
jgi:hypothetical protein